MIRFNYLEANKEQFRLDYLLAKPFPHLILDDICEEDAVKQMLEEIPSIETKSRDYVFASNKFEKSKFWTISEHFLNLYEDFISDRFEAFLSFITNEKVFVDKRFHGGGIHQGKEGSFLDMHLDFNYHPLQKYWFRNLNLLLYLNPGWEEAHGGHLRLKDLRTGEAKDVGVPFNRLVIQQTRNYTLHGYDPIRFPKGKFRTSIAAYAYTEHQHHIEKPRTTDWFVKPNQPVKQFLAKIYDPAVKVKNALFGSATAKH